MLRLPTVILACCFASVAAAQTPAAVSRAEAPPITKRLRPAVRLENRPDTAFDILDRMRYYHVPGVSIAVVDSFRIVYAAGFGVTEFGGSRAVDTTTLFLAGSISKTGVRHGRAAPRRAGQALAR